MVLDGIVKTEHSRNRRFHYESGTPETPSHLILDFVLRTDTKAHLTKYREMLTKAVAEIDQELEMIDYMASKKK